MEMIYSIPPDLLHLQTLMNVLPTRVKMVEHVQMGSTATRVLVFQDTATLNVAHSETGKNRKNISSLMEYEENHVTVFSIQDTRNGSRNGRTSFNLSPIRFVEPVQLFRW